MVMHVKGSSNYTERLCTLLVADNFNFSKQPLLLPLGNTLASKEVAWGHV